MLQTKAKRSLKPVSWPSHLLHLLQQKKKQKVKTHLCLGLVLKRFCCAAFMLQIFILRPPWIKVFWGNGLSASQKLWHQFFCRLSFQKCWLRGVASVPARFCTWPPDRKSHFHHYSDFCWSPHISSRWPSHIRINLVPKGVQAHTRTSNTNTLAHLPEAGKQPVTSQPCDHTRRSWWNTACLIHFVFSFCVFAFLLFVLF